MCALGQGSATIQVIYTAKAFTAKAFFCSCAYHVHIPYQFPLKTPTAVLPQCALRGPIVGGKEPPALAHCSQIYPADAGVACEPQ